MIRDMSFRKFMELEQKPADHISALQDELGIRPQDFEKSPLMGSNFSLGKTSFGTSPYKILGYVTDHTGKRTAAKIQLVNDPSNLTRKQFQDRDGQQVRMPDKPETRVFVVPIDKLNSLMTQGMSAQPGGDAGGMGGMPPM